MQSATTSPALLAEPLPHPTPNRRDLLELLLGYGAILLVLWTPPPFQRDLYFVAAAILLAASLRPRANNRTLGFTAQNLAQSCLILLPVTLLAAAGLALAAQYNTLHLPPTPKAFLQRYWGYSIWAFAQQFLLQDFFLLRFRRLLPNHPTRAILLAAAIFAFAHVPSPILTVFTLVWGLAATAWFVRHANLYPLALSHAILGIAVSCTIPNHTTHNMRVGLGYLTYRPHHHAPHLRNSDHTESTKV